MTLKEIIPPISALFPLKIRYKDTNEEVVVVNKKEIEDNREFLILKTLVVLKALT